MIEEVLSTARSNALVDPALGIWTWEVAVYLFLGGLTAGIMLFVALAHLQGNPQERPFTAYRLALWAPIVLSAGMTTLFLDLEHKLYVFRFYTTLQPTSPMSWGSWVLLLVYPLSVAQIAATLRGGYPGFAAWLQRLPLLGGLLGAAFDLAQRYNRGIMLWSIPIAVALGIYTGVLLSTFSARPFWNSAILGPLFLVSGVSAAAALIILFARHKGERHAFARIDAGLLAAELLLVGLLIVGLASGAQAQLHALQLITDPDSPFAMVFWVLFVVAGLAVPLLLELWEVRGGRSLVVLAPLLVLFGGYLLRQVTLDIGQASTWNEYTVQYDPGLLERLR